MTAPSRLSRRVLALLPALVLACRPAEPPLVNPGVSSQKSDCALLPRGCSNDGCADVVVPLEAGCAVAAPGYRDLERVARELLETPKLTRLIVVAPSVGCANVVRAGLEARGVAQGRLSVAEADNRSFVSFVVEAWDERDCRTGAPSKVPVK